ncbi:hypothetical protein HYPSUDRAFT_44713 [Hypholoma sublateritium FD-334 SS-4]|uniref:Uncharacterized protein n=1 Tax=Hypholoma sublateritium (strain FD-334 SS-4) TaxID=945553 RepID=A0A0D2NJJ0_HYPSF|nr:hypothetical protein HYPSUDRAFT_44713 [Hypholoma sublateritium FD-334 SS-4]
MWDHPDCALSENVRYFHIEDMCTLLLPWGDNSVGDSLYADLVQAIAYTFGITFYLSLRHFAPYLVKA